eukprot:2652466-Alexandrium_andersonii.AAC.1
MARMLFPCRTPDPAMTLLWLSLKLGRAGDHGVWPTSNRCPGLGVGMRELAYTHTPGHQRTEREPQRHAHTCSLAVVAPRLGHHAWRAEKS